MRGKGLVIMKSNSHKVTKTKNFISSSSFNGRGVRKGGISYP